MPDLIPTYRRLPGSGSRSDIPLVVRGARVRLWEGEDHLLLVDSKPYSESYKRFSYRDIQAITAYQTRGALIVSVVLGLIALLFAALTLGTSETVGRSIFAVIFLVLTAFLVGNLIGGPTCKCYLRTAVQVEEIPSLRRIRHLRKALERIGPRIAAVQGTLTPNEAADQMRQLATGSAPRATQSASQPVDPDGLLAAHQDVPVPEAPPVIAEVSETPPPAG